VPHPGIRRVALSAARMHAINGNCYVLLPSAGYGGRTQPTRTVPGPVGHRPGGPALRDRRPERLTIKAANPEGEHSYGVLRMLARTYPGPRVPDPEHEHTNMVTVPLS
jgi:hypothetical protein